MSGTTGTIPLQPWVDDQLITKEVLNGENTNIASLMDANGCGGHSDTDSDAQIQTNPYPGSVLSKATSIAGELERLRYQIAKMLGTDYWYKPAASDLTTIDKGSFIGAIVDAPSATPPNANWHLADGTAISRAAYPNLFAYIGTTFGIGDGSSTFNLPDYRDRMSIGAGTSYALAVTGGSASVTLAKNQIPSGLLTLNDPGHNHTQNAHTHTDSGHTHIERGDVSIIGGVSTDMQINGKGNHSVTDSGTPTASGSANIASTTPTNNTSTTGVSLTDNGGSTAVQTIPPYLAMYKMIRVL